MRKLFRNAKYDVPASIVVFFVAVPLCLGIALASGAPLFSGIIAGIIGGIVVGSLSGSALGVSGPAAGLAVIVLNSIASLGSMEAFLLALVIAGLLQIALGFLRAGIIAYYFPSSVIKGMLTGIGVFIIIKQLPHAIGYDHEEKFNDEFFSDNDWHHNSFTEIVDAIGLFTPGAVVIAIVSLSILILWDVYLSKKHKIFGLIQGPLVAVVSGILLNLAFRGTGFALSEEHLVRLPVFDSFSGFFGSFTTPDFSQISNPKIYAVAFTLAIIASIETLLSVEATDKMDQFKRVTPTNRELVAQGVGNTVSALIGGLPITQVIVRSSANITFGGKTKLSTILHGVFLLVCATSIPSVLNLIPLSTLACVLLVVGFKLAKPSLFKSMYKQGWEQFLPFILTVLGIVFTDMLKGITIGLVMAFFYILRSNYRNSYYKHQIQEGEDKIIHLTLSEDVSFLNKASILKVLDSLPGKSKVVIDGSHSQRIDHDVLEIINEFRLKARQRKIDLEIKGIDEQKQEI